MNSSTPCWPTTVSTLGCLPSSHCSCTPLEGYMAKVLLKELYEEILLEKPIPARRTWPQINGSRLTGVTQATRSITYSLVAACSSPPTRANLSPRPPLMHIRGLVSRWWQCWTALSMTPTYNSTPAPAISSRPRISVST
ncbi:hypothetical protein DPMN_073653 [Dreissena polymorpha]|uniref:Uncharacterized protein n=1 Tax=Dreissena polymorpha TaxID=45954 RepID=A0A9D4BZF0_DREPO|nr:hypothetical protein DPMN_073653 [Dreissena polymorpha]